MLDLIKTGVAELIGTAIFVLLGCLGCVKSFENIPSHMQICLTFGLAVITAVTVSILLLRNSTDKNFLFYRV
jgi:glycerol uptake facilitator-like aquaporin